jgi:ribosome-associated heat shock protein Hsp15
MAEDAVRLDKWLWASRLLKTRSDAAEAARGGRVHLNGRAVKPSHDVKPGDRLDLRLGTRSIELDVLGVSDKRGPAPVAQALYAETQGSVENRERHMEARRLGMAGPAPEKGGRPTKRDRRRMERPR